MRHRHIRKCKRCLIYNAVHHISPYISIKVYDHFCVCGQIESNIHETIYYFGNLRENFLVDVIQYV